MKKQLLTALALLLYIGAFAQNTAYNLTVKLSALKAPAKAYLITEYGWSDSKIIDSAELDNGQFIFKGQTPEPVKTYILVNHSGKDGAKWNIKNDALLLYLESGSITVTGTDSVKHATISGSKLNNEYARYSAVILSPVEKVTREVNAEYTLADDAKKKDSAFQAGLMLKIKKATRISDSLKYVYIKQNPASYLSLAALIELAGNNPDVAQIEPVFKNLAPAMRNSPTGLGLAKMLYDIGPTAVGAIAPDFTQNDVNGKPVKLSDFRGKYVLLDFWASWCGPCRAENPNVVKAYEKYKGKNFTILGVSLDRPGQKATWLAAIKSDGLPWTQVSDLQFWNNAAAKQYEIRSIPQNFLIDPKGKIIAKNLRGDMLSEKLAALLK